MAEESNDLHGMAPDSNDTALLLIDVINHLDFEGNEGFENRRNFFFHRRSCFVIS